MRRPSSKKMRFIGVYDADSTWRGELTYWIGARLGRRHCSLCHITHGAISAREEWSQCRARLIVPFDTYHRDDLPDGVRALGRTSFPVVLVESDHGMRVLLGPAEIEACEGAARSLESALVSSLASEITPFTLDE